MEKIKLKRAEARAPFRKFAPQKKSSLSSQKVWTKNLFARLIAFAA